MNEESIELKIKDLLTAYAERTNIAVTSVTMNWFEGTGGYYHPAEIRVTTTTFAPREEKE